MVWRDAIHQISARPASLFASCVCLFCAVVRLVGLLVCVVAVVSLLDRWIDWLMYRLLDLLMGCFRVCVFSWGRL